MNEFELKILDWIQANLRSGFLDPILKAVTHLGDAGIFWIALAVLFLIFKKTRPLGIVMGVALILDLILCNGIAKPLVNRIRPYALKEAVDGVTGYPLVKAPTDASFPSGHTAASFACVFALLFKKSRLWIPALVLSVLIAFSRLYLYVHFPTDILGGILIGLIVGYLGAKLGTLLENAIRKKFPKAL